MRRHRNSRADRAELPDEASSSGMSGRAAPREDPTNDPTENPTEAFGEAALREVLRHEAARHRPDREAILARVTAGRSPDRRARSRRPVVRLVGLGAASAVLLGLSVAGTWAAVGQYVRPPSTSSTAPGDHSTELGSATSVPRPTAASSGAGGRSSADPGAAPSAAGSPSGGSSVSASASASGLPTASAAPAPSAGTRVQQGFLWSDGSIDPGSNANWAQSDVTLKSRFTLTALDVRLSVALTPGVAAAGAWSTLPAQDLVATVTRQGNELVYEWTLKPGVTLAPGTYTFAGQYDHAAGGRDAGQDSYQAAATGHGGQALVYGNFYPTGR